VENELLAQQASDPRLAGFRIARNEHVASTNRERELAAIFRIAEQQSAPCPWRDWQPATVSEGTHVFSNRRRT
jgi:hypothetical protein